MDEPVWHYYPGGGKPGSTVDQNVLCVLGGDNNFALADVLPVTTLKAQVTCQNCIEWLRA